MPALPWFLKLIVVTVVEKLVSALLAPKRALDRRRKRKGGQSGQNPP